MLSVKPVIFNDAIIANIFGKYSFIHIKNFAVVINTGCLKMVYSAKEAFIISG